MAAERHPEIALLEELVAEAPFIGDIGLDGSPQHSGSITAQRDVFIRALAAAQATGGRVLSIHAGELRERFWSVSPSIRRPIACCPFLTGSPTWPPLRAVPLNKDYFSINHRMLESDAGAALVRSLPGDRLLTETDAPFTSMGERKSEPRDVVNIAERLATLRGEPVEDLRDRVMSNAARVIRFTGITASYGTDLT